MLSQDRLKFLLHYDEASGQFTWIGRSGPGCNRRVGDKAGSPNSDGYIQIGIDGVLHKAHRLAFLWMTGEFPKKFVDHINGDRFDNRWMNLRPATVSENKFNSRLGSNNKSGVKGVTWYPPSQKWRANIAYNKRYVHLGTFETKELAIEFRQLAAELVHGEYVNHGG